MADQRRLPVRVRARLFAAVGLLSAALVFAPAIARAADARRPNILLILIDTLRADHLGAYGYARPTSPFLDSLASKGTRFTRAYSTASWTQPAVESLFTGDRPAVLAPRSVRYIPPRTTTLASTLSEVGYRTAGFVANPFVHRGGGYGQGFDEFRTWPLRGPGGKTNAPKATADWINGLAKRWLDDQQKRGDSPWFLYLQYMEPHSPYLPGEEYARRFWRDRNLDLASSPKTFQQKLDDYHAEKGATFSPAEVAAMIDLYDAAIAEVDAAIAEFVNQLDAETRANMIICITADHGEEFNDHGRFLHAHSLFEELIHVPLIIVSPKNVLGASQIDDVVQISDVAPTLVDLAGLPVPAAFSGRSLRNAATESGHAAMAELAPFKQTFHRQALVRERYKLVVPMEGDEALLFDLRSDPHEQQNLADKEPAQTAGLKAELTERIHKPRIRVVKPPPTVMPNASLRERLRALGYDF